MELYERLSRMLMRRKYARVENRAGTPWTAKGKSVKAPRARAMKPKLDVAEASASSSTTTTPGCSSSEAPGTVLPPVPKRFELRSSNNEVIDGAWFNNALRRSVAEGRLNLGTTL